MAKAYLQNKKAQYYHLDDEGKVALIDRKTALQSVPQIMQPEEEVATGNIQYKTFSHTGYVFMNDGCRILSHLFFTAGPSADCVLTVEQDDLICGDLDFSTARVYGRREIRINCVHF